MAPPFKQAEFDVMFAEGISKTGELVDIGVERKIVDKSGAWFSYGAERIGQGRDAAKEFLKMHPAVAREIETKIHEAAGMRPRPAASGTSAEIDTPAKPAVEKRSDEKRIPSSRV